MTIAEVIEVFERQFGSGTFPDSADEFVLMSSNDLYQFAHAVVREHLACKLEEQLEDTDGPVGT